MFRSIIVFTALGLFAMVGCKDGDKAAEGTDKKEGAEKVEEKKESEAPKAPTCDDAWAAFSKLNPAMAQVPKEALEQTKKSFMTGCAQQPPEKLACLVNAKTMEDAEKCK